FQTIHKKLKENKLNENLLTVCKEFKPCHYERLVEGEHWDLVKNMIFVLLDKQLQGIVVDWSQMIEQFKEAYLTQIKIIWATFYSQIQEDLENINEISVVNEKVEMSYVMLQNKLSFYLYEDILVPTGQCLQSILQKSYNDLLHISSTKQKNLETKSLENRGSLVGQLFQGIMKTGEEMKRERSVESLSDKQNNVVEGNDVRIRSSIT
ncbi:MAG: hypothetical protein JO131_07995, partial [Gammaproteobacteria bacterium]|nr:hypothetical protein [Gammaproteobacteria bacterium]